MRSKKGLLDVQSHEVYSGSLRLCAAFQGIELKNVTGDI